jgi:endonuclease YncB( thermonuclease family)
MKHCLLVVLLAFAWPALAAPCQVTKVTDGDTIRMTCGRTAHRVRLLGFDTPEIFHPKCTAERQAGLQAARLMRRLVATGRVTQVEFKGRDHYGRDLAHVQIAGTDLASAMLASGLALPYAGHRHPDWCALLPG